jgi:hypothetical protein
VLDTMEVLKRRDAINFANLLIENNLNVQNYPEVTLFVPPERSLQVFIQSFRNLVKVLLIEKYN